MISFCKLKKIINAMLPNNYFYNMYANKAKLSNQSNN